jgi:hypothetical protein
MNRSFVKLVSLVILALASLLLPLGLWRHARVSVRALSRQSRSNTTRLAALLEENLRLSNVVAQARQADLSPGEQSELLKLRGEIGRLRHSVVEANDLAARNASLAAGLTNAGEPNRPASLPQDQTILAHWPRAELGFAGYSDPASALKTMLWAMAQGDTNVLLTSVTAEIRTRMLRQDWNEHGTAAEELAASARKIADSLQPSTGFYVVGQRAIAEDQVVLDVFFEGEGRLRKFAMKQVNGEWKFNALGHTGAADTDVHAGFSAWP